MWDMTYCTFISKLSESTAVKHYNHQTFITCCPLIGGIFAKTNGIIYNIYKKDINGMNMFLLIFQSMVGIKPFIFVALFRTVSL